MHGERLPMISCGRGVHDPRPMQQRQPADTIASAMIKTKSEMRVKNTVRLDH